jgi:hypothetical protein
VSEDSFQITVADLLRRYAPPSVIWFHTPNAGKRSKRTGARLKKMGMRPGVADIVIATSTGTLFLELKDGAKGRKREGQVQFAADCEAAGIPYAVARDVEQAASILHGWGALTINPLVGVAA